MTIDDPSRLGLAMVHDQRRSLPSIRQTVTLEVSRVGRGGVRSPKHDQIGPLANFPEGGCHHPDSLHGDGGGREVSGGKIDAGTAAIRERKRGSCGFRARVTRAKDERQVGVAEQHGGPIYPVDPFGGLAIDPTGGQ